LWPIELAAPTYDQVTDYLAGGAMGTELAEAKRRLNSPQQRHHVQMLDAPPAGQRDTTQIISN